MPLKLRHDEETPAPRRQNPPAPALVLAPEARTHASLTPTFAKMGRSLVRPRLRRPKLAQRGAAITLVLSGIVTLRWLDANVEPNWPTYAPSYPKAMTGPNAANFYHAALDSFDLLDGTRYQVAAKALPLTPKGQYVGWSDLSDRAAPLALKRAATLDNAEALKWLHEAGTKNYYGNFDGKWLKTHVVAAPSLSSPVPNFIAIRELARMAAGSCDVLAAEGKKLEAFDRALDVAKWGTDQTHDPTLIQGMIGILIEGIGQAKALEIVDSLSPEEAKVALARLESLPKPARFSEIVAGEEAFCANTFRDLFKSGDMSSVDLMSAKSSQTFLGNIAGKVVFDGGLLIFTKRGLVENYTGVMEEYKRLSSMPYREALAPMTAFQSKVERGEGLNFLTRIAVPNFTRARWAYEAKNAQREILRARLMLRGDGKLTRMPLDPFSVDAMQSLRYDAATGKVWSVGSNGLDELGKGDDDLKSP